MKTKILAVILAVCMMAGACTLFASAGSFAAGSYVQKIATNGTLTNDNLKAAIQGTDFNAIITVSPKTNISLPAGVVNVTAGNVDTLFSFKKGTQTLTYTGELHRYFGVSGYISGNTAVANFTDKAENTIMVYEVTTNIVSSDTDVSAKVSATTKQKYLMEGSGTYSATITKWITALSTLRFGTRLYAPGGVYDMDSIAVVNAIINHQSGAVSAVTSTSSLYTNELAGLLPGDEVTLTTHLLDATDADYYAFNCWVDGSGNVISTYKELTVTLDGNSVSVYASYMPIQPHIRFLEDKINMIYKDSTVLQTFPGAARLESSNPKVVRVNAETGEIEAVRAGKATITAYSADGATATCEVTVRYTFAQLLIRIFLLGFLWY